MTNRLALVLTASIFVAACSNQTDVEPQPQSTDNVDSSTPQASGQDMAETAPAPTSDPAGEMQDSAPATAANTAASPETGKRIVDCKIISGGKQALDAPCEFSPQSNGGFTLTSKTGGGALYGRISSVSVSKIDKTNAEVRGLTSDGINSRWGAATRSAQDPACWNGNDFSVCAY
ncbi:hypothetical protein [Pseudoblastomonas halimionae]|uniref:Uncharacterized protein n=1 Tax=Alteriqipengyuania halimionae TaxID=1926630 RepID=A0A6I4U3L2_9SPHN|nr:hypothetical protein [Alteriqipengyuania halimionae]MXP09072.1 hypothetical protein [Alteriqipengyuania halimionae]